MSAAPAARFLTEFGVEGEADGGARKGAGTAGPAAATDELTEAFARGVERGQGAARAEFEARFAAQQSTFTKRLELERQKWVVDTADKLANSLAAGLQDLEARIADAAARILKPFLEAEMHRQAIAELRASLDALVTMEPGVSLHIKGPADVLEVLRAQLANKRAASTFETDDGGDIRIVSDHVILETRLKDWLARLEEALR